MAKKKSITVYKCSECGYTQPTWLGRCPECGSWNTLEECISDPNSTAAAFGQSATEKIKPVPLANVTAQENARVSTEIGEFDRVLGGGAMKRSAILIGGEPGIGKSTLMIQTATAIAKKYGKVLYVSGEESAGQLKGRADRLNLDTKGIEILCTMRLEDIKDALSALNPLFVVIDSIQTVYSVEAGIVPGTINQLKFCANELTGWVKSRDSVLIMSAHVTKEGNIAGPKSLEHMVDTVISFERNDDEVRFLRAQKNRFGSVDELGIFAMTDKGLEGVGDPSTRVARVAAVLEKRTGIRFSDQDLYINVAGGVRLTESSIDAALAASLYSARTDLSIPENTVITGELSLAGEIRPVARLKQRIKTAGDLGFTSVLAPEKDNGSTKIESIKEMIKILFAK